MSFRYLIIYRADVSLPKIVAEIQTYLNQVTPPKLVGWIHFV